MTPIRATRPFSKHTYDEVVYGFVFTNVLPTGVTISSVATPVVALESGVSTTTITLTGQAANSATFVDDDGTTVAIGKAVQATVTGGTAGCYYAVTIKVTASNGEKYGGVFVIEVPE